MALAKSQLIAGAIEVYDDVLPNVGDFLSEVLTSDKWQPATIRDMVSTDSSIRDNFVQWVDPLSFRNPPHVHEFMKAVWHHVDDYATRFDQSFGGMEIVNINRYMPGQQYHAHADAGGQNANRVISALVYLNDDFSGGETKFVHFGESITPKKGRLVIFPSNYAYAHAALPPESGIKYSAAFWFVA